MRRLVPLVLAAAVAAGACGARSGLAGPRPDAGPDGDADADADADADGDGDGDADADADADADSDADGDADDCPGSMTWRIETVTPHGREPRVTVAEDGTPHVLYHHLRYLAEEEHAVAYATRSAGVWTTEFLETQVTPRAGVIELGLDGEPLVAYSADDGLGGAESSVSFARLGLGGWERDVLGTADDYFEEVDLAVGEEGAAHVLFSRWSQGLVHAEEVDGDWELTTIQEAPWLPRCAAIAVDSTGLLHVLGYSEENLGHWVGSGTDWSLVTSREGSGSQCSLVVDQDDRPLGLFATERELFVVDLEADGWAEERIDVNPRRISRLALSPDGALHFAYTDAYDDGAVALATGAFGAGSWDRERIDESRGSDPSIAVAAEEIHVFYSVWVHGQDDSKPENHLRHAVRCLH